MFHCHRQIVLPGGIFIHGCRKDPDKRPWRIYGFPKFHFLAVYIYPAWPILVQFIRKFRTDDIVPQPACGSDGNLQAGFHFSQFHHIIFLLQSFFLLPCPVFQIVMHEHGRRSQFPHPFFLYNINSLYSSSTPSVSPIRFICPS